MENTTIKELSRILKPTPNRPFFEYCASWAKEINEATENFEIAGQYTRTGNPVIIFIRS